jgi:hypothetical protein
MPSFSLVQTVAFLNSICFGFSKLPKGILGWYNRNILFFYNFGRINFNGLSRFTADQVDSAPSNEIAFPLIF